MVGAIKKLLMAMVVLVFMTVPAFAVETTILTCDPQAGVIRYDVEVNGTVVENVGAFSDGALNFNLDGWLPGPYTFRARAYGQEDWPSDWSDPYDATKPASPGSSLKIIKVEQ